MTDPELFKYDVRVRERMLRKGLVQEPEVEKRLQALPDLEAQCVEFELKQPALSRQDAESAPVPRPAPAAPSPASPSFGEAPRRLQADEDLSIPDDEDEDEDDDLDEDDEDDDDLDEDEAETATAKEPETAPSEDGVPEKQPTPGEGWENEP